MALFVLAPKVGTKALEELFQRPLGRTFFKHRSWMWWTAMRHSGLERHWHEFAYFHNEGVSICQLLKTVRSVATPEEWLLLSRRLGVPVFKPQEALNPHWYSRKGAEYAYWTKGGTWDRRNNFTRVIVLGQGIRTRDHNHNTITRKLSFRNCEQIEKEVFNIVDPDALLYPDAIDKAVEYVRWRIPTMIGRKARSSYSMVSWFFQRDVPGPGGVFYYKGDTKPRRVTQHTKDLRWLP